MHTLHLRPGFLSLSVSMALACLSAAALGAQAADKPSEAGKNLLVAVLEPSGNDGVTAMHKKSARGGLEEYISGARSYKVLDRSRYEGLLSKKQKEAGGLPDEKVVKNLGKKAGADFICASDLYREGDYFNVTCWLVDARTGETTTANDFVKKDTPVEVAFVVGTLAGRLLGVESQKLAQVREEREAEAQLAESEAEARAAMEAAEREASEAAEMARLEREERGRRTAAEREAGIAAAKKTVERLLPNFDVEGNAEDNAEGNVDNGGAATYTNRALAQFAEQQRAAVLAKKTDAGHALSARIAQGGVMAHSKYAYRGEANGLGHTKLSVTVGSRTASSPLVPAKDIKTAGGMGVEEAELTDAAVLRLIAENPNGQARVRIENREGFFKTFTLNPAAQRGIAQTMELFDAMETLKKLEAEERAAAEAKAKAEAEAKANAEAEAKTKAEAEAKANAKDGK